MSDEILYTGAGDRTYASVLAIAMELLLADRASFRNNAYLVDLGGVENSGSTTKKQPYVGLDGYDAMSAVTEGSEVANTAFSDDSQTVAVGRQALRYEMSDLLDMITPQGGVDVERLAESMVMAAEMRLTAMICGVIDDFTNTAGTSGADFTFADFQTAIYLLERAPAPTAELVSILAPIQLTDLQTDLTGLSGVMQYLPATADMIQAKGTGLQGRLLGVDIWKSTKVVTSSSDRKGGMWHRGAVVMSEGTPKGNRIAANQKAQNGRVMVEFARNAGKALTGVIGNYYVGVSRSTPNDALGATLISDST
jgi:hypothetical protein